MPQMDAAAGRVGTAPPGVVYLVHMLLAEQWGDAQLSYAGWGAPHLKVCRRPVACRSVHRSLGRELSPCQACLGRLLLYSPCSILRGEKSSSACAWPQVRTQHRAGNWIIVCAEFEYGYDDGDAVWGGRAEEELFVSVDSTRNEWSSPRPLHGEWHAFKKLRAEYDGVAQELGHGRGGGRELLDLELGVLEASCRVPCD